MYIEKLQVAANSNGPFSLPWVNVGRQLIDNTPQVRKVEIVSQERGVDSTLIPCSGSSRSSIFFDCFRRNPVTQVISMICWPTTTNRTSSNITSKAEPVQDILICLEEPIYSDNTLNTTTANITILQYQQDITEYQLIPLKSKELINCWISSWIPY